MIKRKLEHMRQSMAGGKSTTSGSGGAPFRPTCNARNTNMLQEVNVFAQHLRTLHKDLAELAQGYQGSMSVLQFVMSAPLPRVYEPMPEPTPRSPASASNEPNVAPLGEPVAACSGSELAVTTSTANELRAAQQSEVLKPIEGWLAALSEIQKKHSMVSNIALDLDAQRRVVATVTERSSRASEDKDLTRKLMEEEAKMQRLQQRFTEKEADLHSALLALAKDTAVVKHYIAFAMSLYEDAFGRLNAAFSGTFDLAALKPETTLTIDASPCSDQTAAPGTLTPGGSASSKPLQASSQPLSSGRPSLQLSPSMPRTGELAPGWHDRAKLQSSPLEATGSSNAGSGSDAEDGGKPAERPEGSSVGQADAKVGSVPVVPSKGSSAADTVSNISISTQSSV